jgi:hypothetical protein
MGEGFVPGLLIGLLGGAVVGFLACWVWLGAPTARLALGRQVFKKLTDADFARKVEALLVPPPPPKPDGTPLRVLALLQAEARFIDFLMDDLSKGTPEQIVAAVRELHPKAQAALKKALDVEPVRTEPEQTTVTVPAGFDPSAIKVVGNVTGQPPYAGTLVHPGWRVKAMRLPAPPEGVDEFVLQPAEVELP